MQTCNAIIEGARTFYPEIDGDNDSLLNPENHSIRHDMAGFYILTEDEAAHEDAGNQSVGFDGREHFDTIDEARDARDLTA